MSYTVFALKWRPQNFDEIVGQKHIATTLKHAIEKNRLAHAYLFAGPRGVGKTSTARILAKALNCKNGPSITPCGKCISCVEITKGTSLDVIEIDGASNRQIDDIRALRENVKFAPTQGKFKVYIIDEVHMLTNEAFNALLKTLEEPPSFVKFIFATTHPHKMPSTILSRCQRLDFRRISTMEIIGQLNKITAAENINVDKDVLFAITKSSDGSLRDAESILDQLTAFSENRLSLKDIISVFGLIEQETLFTITDKIIAKDAKSALELLNNIIDEGKDINVFLANLIEHFRNLMIAKITQSDSELLDLPQEDCDKLLKQSQTLQLEEIFSFFNILIAAEDMGKRLDSMRISLEIALVRLANNKKGAAVIAGKQSQESFVNIPNHNEIKSKVPETIKTKPLVCEEMPASAITLDDIKGSWQKIIDKLAKIKISAASYFNEGSPSKLEKNTLTVYFPKNYSLHKESLERKENRELIEKIFFELFNNKIRINFMLSADIVSTEDLRDPFVKTALETFNGRVIKEE